MVLVESPTTCQVENVAVDPERQGEGIGRVLLDHAEEPGAEAGLAEIRLYTHSKMTENRAIYAPPRLPRDRPPRRGGLRPGLPPQEAPLNPTGPQITAGTLVLSRSGRERVATGRETVPSDSRRGGCSALPACGRGRPGRAELASGNLFITFKGGIAPNALPRAERGADRRLDGGQGEDPLGGKAAGPAQHHDRPQPRRRARHAGACRPAPRARLEGSSSAQALAACSDALVGTGQVPGAHHLPRISRRSRRSARSSPSTRSCTEGRRSWGRSTASSPARSTSVIVFEIRHPAGTFGTVLSGSVPSALTKYSYLKRISLRLHRTYSYRGRGPQLPLRPVQRPEGPRARPPSRSSRPRCPSPTAARWRRR